MDLLFLFLPVNIKNAIHLHPPEWLLSKNKNPNRKKEKISAGEETEKLEPLCTIGRNVNGCSH